MVSPVLGVLRSRLLRAPPPPPSSPAIPGSLSRLSFICLQSQAAAPVTFCLRPPPNHGTGHLIRPRLPPNHSAGHLSRAPALRSEAFPGSRGRGLRSNTEIRPRPRPSHFPLSFLRFSPAPPGGSAQPIGPSSVRPCQARDVAGADWRRRAGGSGWRCERRNDDRRRETERQADGR